MKIIVSTLLVFLSTSLFGQKSHLWGEIEKIIKNEEDVDLTMASGTVIGIVDWDSVYTYQIGTLSKNSTTLITDSTTFPAGGTTHAHLLMLAYHMYELGLIHPDDSIGRFNIPEFKNSWINKIRLSDLMAHTSGLPKILPGMVKYKVDEDDEYALFEKDSIDSHLVKWSLLNKRSSQFNHSQYNFYLLSKILWMVRDTRVHNDGVMIPEMKNTSFVDSDGNDELKSYSREGRLIPHQHLNGLVQTMGMKTTMHDMMILLKVYLRLSSGEDFNNFCLKEENEKKGKKDDSYTNGGFRYFTTKKSGSLYFMTGVTKGSSAFICFAPKTHTGIYIFSNSGKSVHTLGMHIMRMINYNYTRTY